MIQIQTIAKNANGSWTFTWLGSGSFRVVLQGILLATVPSNSYTWTGQSKVPPPLEVVAIGSLALSEQYRPYLIIQWYGESADVYLVQRNDSGHWNTILTVQEVGQWVYTFQTTTLLDETIYQYRVISQDKIGNQAPARGYKALIVCPPAPPNVKIGYTNPNVSVS